MTLISVVTLLYIHHFLDTNLQQMGIIVLCMAMSEMKEEQASKTLKETLSEMVERAEKRCDDMKKKLFEVKEDMKEKPLSTGMCS